MYRAAVSSDVDSFIYRLLKFGELLTRLLLPVFGIEHPDPHFWDLFQPVMEVPEVSLARADESNHDSSLFQINDTKAKPVSSDDERPQEALDALLTPERQPRLTDKGPEPIFSGKALAVMAIWQSDSRRLTAYRISLWTRRHFLYEGYKALRHTTEIRRLLQKDDDFVKISEGGVSWFTLHHGLERRLQDMKDPKGKPFDPFQHVNYHARVLLELDQRGLGSVKTHDPSCAQSAASSKATTSSSIPSRNTTFKALGKHKYNERFVANVTRRQLRWKTPDTQDNRAEDVQTDKNTKEPSLSTNFPSTESSLRRWEKSEGLSRPAQIGEVSYQPLEPEDDEGLRGFSSKDDIQGHVQDQLHGSIPETRLDNASPVPGHDVDHSV